jgi:hypothetical protein
MLEVLHWALNDRPQGSASGFSLRPVLEQMALDGEVSWGQVASLCISTHDTWGKDTIIKRAKKCGSKLKVGRRYGLK